MLSETKLTTGSFVNKKSSDKKMEKLTRIEEYIEDKKEKGEKVLIPFIMAGDPDISFTERIALEIMASGGDILEIGLPYSDPLADGPVIQEASERAKGTKIKEVVELIKRLREKTDKPLVLLAYFNPIFNYGIARFIDDFYHAGLNGLVIPDIDFEKRDELEKLARGKLDIINFITPTSSEARLKEVAERARGFIYCVSMAGVTGKREDFQLEIERAVKKVRKYTNVPLAIGFGISSSFEAKKAGELADGVIVGSAIIDRISSLTGFSNCIDTKHISKENNTLDVTFVTGFVRELKDALKWQH